MTDFQISPTKSSISSDVTFHKRAKASYHVPDNSLCSFTKQKDEDKYIKNNSEKKTLITRSCLHQGNSNRQSKLSQSSPNQQSSESSRDQNNPLSFTQFSMFYEKQQLVERKPQNAQENNSATVIFKSDAKVMSCTNTVLKQDVDTNTDPESCFQPSKYTPNSSIISMKSSKPEQGDPSLLQKTFNVQKMPSVNIRPGFTIQSGPKINIVGSSSDLYKPKRKNLEVFDIVYTSSKHAFTNSGLEENKRLIDPKHSQHLEYICERHVFPSGKLIPGPHDDERRDSQLLNISLDEKKVVLIGLIKSVMDKIEEQLSREKKNCCRLTYSLPLLASVVNKIQVDCSKCVNILSKQMDRLVQLMKEELRSQRELSEDHCCMLDETVQYQIVELELIQDENSNKKSADTIRVFKHQECGNYSKVPKKTVSFECIPNEAGKSAKQETSKYSQKKSILSSSHTKSTTLINTASKIKPSLKSQKIGVIESLNDAASSCINNHIDSKSQNKLKQHTKRTNNIATKETAKGLVETKEKTVVGQAIQNLSITTVFKSDSTSETPCRNGNKHQKCNSLNAFSLVRDYNDTMSGFDQWVKDRSHKILNIHKELSRMVKGSVGGDRLSSQVVKDQITETMCSSINEDATDKLNEKEEEIRKTNSNWQERSTNDEVSKGSEILRSDIPFQENNQDYLEDFEDDLEELSNNSSRDSHQQTLTEAEKQIPSSSSDTSEIITSEEKEVVTPVKNDLVLDKQISECLSTKTEDIQSGDKKTNTLVLKGHKIKNVIERASQPHFPSESFIDNPSKVSFATSPIHFNLLDESVQNQVLIQKTSIGTSPINLNEVKPTFRSVMVQTEDLAIKITSESIPDKCTTSSNMELLVPSVKLNPTPIENILQVSLNQDADNSFAIQTNSSNNQSMKLIVQLSNSSEKGEEGEKIINPDSYHSQDRKDQRDVLVKSAHNCQRERKVNLSSKVDKSTLFSEARSESPGNVHVQPILSEKMIKDIIEPTVSEVLNKMNNPSMSDKNDGETGMSKAAANRLITPNVILQTKYNYWQKCDDDYLCKFIDLDLKQKTDSSNQTETEKQNVCIQVEGSLAGIVSEKAISTCKYLCEAQEFSKGCSYLDMVQPPLILTETIGSSATSSTCHSTSRSLSSSSSSSRKKENALNLREKLSEGELMQCKCVIGEACNICVPRLNLSFGELKTKRNKKRQRHFFSGSDSDGSGNLKSEDSCLSSVPLHLEPRPTSSHMMSSKGHIEGFDIVSKRLTVGITHNNNFNKVFKDGNIAQNEEKKPIFKQFSDIANSVISELNKEYLQSVSADSKHVSNPYLNLLQTKNASSSKQFEYYSSSESTKSSHSKCSKKSLSLKNSKKSASLVIKPSIETPKIDIVMEDPFEMSLSSYQTSVTSVSVDNLAAALNSNSSSELHQLSQAE